MTSNLVIFFRAPLYFSYREVQRSQQELTDVVDSLRQLARPQQTVIVGFDSHFLGYRHAGYYLPEFLTIQFPEVPLGSSTGVFTMQNRNTRLVSQVQLGSFRDFILFPLPSEDKEYREYMQKIRMRFSTRQLRAITQNGREFLTGPVNVLQVMFPNTVTLEPRMP